MSPDVPWILSPFFLAVLMFSAWKQPTIPESRPVFSWRSSMHFRVNIVALFIICLPLAAAQQLCYWPNGSGIGPDQGIWVNCYSSQDSACCLSGDVCLSNGLCYGSPIAVVCPLFPVPLPQTTIRIALIETDSSEKTYRGACTVKDWSNTTACPTQWCNDGKHTFQYSF